MRSLVSNFFLLRSRRKNSSLKGQTLVEYALILAVLAIVFITAFAYLGSKIVVIFSAITALLDSAQSSTF